MDRAYSANVSATPPAAGTAIGYPQDSNPGAGQPPTIPGAGWFHAITEEIRAVIVAAGATPNAATLTQLRDAINALAGSLASAAQAAAVAAAAIDATTKADAARTGAVSDVNAEFTGANQSLGASSGYQKTPGGLIFQWGTVTEPGGGTNVAVTFPIAFPTACVYAGAMSGDAAAVLSLASAPTTTGATFNNGGGTGSRPYLAIGF